MFRPVGREGRFQKEGNFLGGMREAKLPGMEQDTSSAGYFFPGAVFEIPHNGVSTGRKLSPYLMFAAGEGIQQKKTSSLATFEPLPPEAGAFPLSSEKGPPFLPVPVEKVFGKADFRWFSMDYGQI